MLQCVHFWLTAATPAELTAQTLSQELGTWTTHVHYGVAAPAQALLDRRIPTSYVQYRLSPCDVLADDLPHAVATIEPLKLRAGPRIALVPVLLIGISADTVSYDMNHWSKSSLVSKILTAHCYT